METAEADRDAWLPDRGGIVYNSQMDVFDLFFFKYPRGEWLYIYGYEAGLMMPEDLQVLRNIQFNRGAWAAYRPWVEKMKPADRMIVLSPVQPVMADLEWREYRKGIWIGRLRKIN